MLRDTISGTEEIVFILTTSFGCCIMWTYVLHCEKPLSVLVSEVFNSFTWHGCLQESILQRN
jgi:hypothetical protein